MNGKVKIGLQTVGESNISADDNCNPLKPQLWLNWGYSMSFRRVNKKVILPKNLNCFVCVCNAVYKMLFPIVASDSHCFLPLINIMTCLYTEPAGPVRTKAQGAAWEQQNFLLCFKIIKTTEAVLLLELKFSW